MQIITHHYSYIGPWRIFMKYIKNMVFNKHILKSYFGVLPLSGWTLVALVVVVTLFQLFQQYAFHLTSGFDFDFSWFSIANKLVIKNMLWAVFSPILLRLGRKTSNIKHIIDRRVFSYTIVLIVISIMHDVLSLWLYNFSYYLQVGYMRDFLGTNNRSDLVSGVFTSLIEGVVIVGLFMALDYQRKLSDKERDLAKAELNALKMQLHPHFIFNTLHSISSMIDLDVKSAQRMLSKVGELLRSMLVHDKVEFVTLKEEIDFIRNYLELEQIRFQDRMEIEFDVDESLTACKLPSLILQPLVENCIKHGVSKNMGMSRIQVVASRFVNGSTQPWLSLEINNYDVHGGDVSPTKGFGIGLENVKRRLEQNYSNDHYCNFERLNERHFKSEIRIPLKK